VPRPIVLGIDPGTRVLGYGALLVAPEGPRFLACGILKPPARATVSARLGEILRDLERLLAALKPASWPRARLPLEERPGGASNRRGARRRARVGGFGRDRRRRARAGGGQEGGAGPRAASKEQVRAHDRAAPGHGSADVPGDATDALALAYASLKRSGPAARATLAARAADASNGRNGHAGEEGRRARALRERADAGAAAEAEDKPRSRGRAQEARGPLAALTEGLDEIVPGIEILDRELSFEGGARADLAGVDPSVDCTSCCSPARTRIAPRSKRSTRCRCCARRSICSYATSEKDA
jgi:crossover junction endodeoxyribonuclease RuvC